MVRLKIIYVNKVPSEKLENGAYNLNNSVSFTLVDNNIVPINNPPTGVNSPVIYIIVMIAFLICIIISLKYGKKNKLFYFLIMLCLYLPLYSYAENKIDIKVNANITIDGKEAYLITGKEFNIKAKKLAGNDTSVDTHNTLLIISGRYSLWIR